jgi:hypothetical protein
MQKKKKAAVLWLVKDATYPYDQVITKPEGQDPEGIRLEVPFDDKLMALKNGAAPSYVWYKLPLEVFDPESGYKLNPAVFSGGNPESEADAYVPSAVVTTEIQAGDSVVTPYLVLPSCKRRVAGQYFCFRKDSNESDYEPIARFTVSIVNTQEEFYALEGARVMISAPVTAPVLHGAEITYRWSVYQYPTPDLVLQVTRSLQNATDRIRERIALGDLNPFSDYLRLPVHHREISLVLCGYVMDARGKIDASRPLPPAFKFDDLSSIYLRLRDGYESLVGDLGQNARDFLDQIYQDVVRLYSGDRIFRRVTSGTVGLRNILIKSASAERHRGLYVCETLASAGVDREAALRKLFPDLPGDYGSSWLPCATVRFRVLDPAPTNRKSPEVTSSVYSLHGSKTPSVTILDAEDPRKRLEMALRDVPAQFAPSRGAAISWHLELIPSDGDTTNAEILENESERSPDQEARFIRRLVTNLNRLAASADSTRYLFSGRIGVKLDAQGLVAATNSSETYDLDVTAERFGKEADGIFAQLRGIIRAMDGRRMAMEALREEFQFLLEHVKAPGYTAVFGAFLENPEASGTPVGRDLDAARYSDERLFSDAVNQRLVAYRLESVGLGRAKLKENIKQLENFARQSLDAITIKARELAPDLERTGEELPGIGSPSPRVPIPDAPDYEYRLGLREYHTLIALHERQVETLELERSVHDRVFSGPDLRAAEDYQLAEARFSSTEKPLLGLVAFQYGLDRRTAEYQRRIARMLSSRSLIEDELRSEAERARQVIESNIPIYEPLIKTLLSNRRVAAEYADSLIKGAPEDVAKSSAGAMERYLVSALKGAARNPKILFRAFRIRPLSYGPPESVLNAGGFDAAWHKDSKSPDDNKNNYTFIAPLACGEGFSMFPSNASEGAALTPESIAWIVLCFRAYSSLLDPGKPDPVFDNGRPELVRRPDSRTSEEVVKFMSDPGNSAAFVGLLSAQRNRSIKQDRRAMFENLSVVCAQLPDLRIIQDQVSLTDDPLAAFAEAVRAANVQDDEFSSKRYRRLLGSLMINKLARLASLLNIVGFYTASGGSDREVSVSEEEQASRELHKRGSFNAQAFVSKAPLPNVAVVIEKLMSTQEYARKLSDQDISFLREFFRVPQPPLNATNLDDTPTLVLLPGQDDPQQKLPPLEPRGRVPFAVSPGDVAPDIFFGRRPKPDDPFRGEDDQNLKAPYTPAAGGGRDTIRTPPSILAPTPPRRTPLRPAPPGLDDPDQETDDSRPAPLSPPSTADDDLIKQLVTMFSSLEVRDSDRVGEARYIRPGQAGGTALAAFSVNSGSSSRSEDSSSAVILTAEDRFRLTKDGLIGMIREAMQRSGKYLKVRADRIHERLAENLAVIRSLEALNYASKQDKLESELLRGALLNSFETSLRKAEEIIEDAFESLSSPSGRGRTNRILNEIRKSVMTELNDVDGANASRATILSTVAEVADRVYAKVERELDDIDTRFVLPDRAIDPNMFATQHVCHPERFSRGHDQGVRGAAPAPRRR